MFLEFTHAYMSYVAVSGVAHRIFGTEDGLLQ